MLVDPSNSTAGSAVTSAIKQASQATGTSFNYLLATAQVESGLNALAGAATSSARGLFQFIQQTWLATMKQAGPALGYGQYAAAITKNASGQYDVADSTMRSEILKLRNDPTANAAMAGAFTQANAAVLNQRLGRPPTEGELYTAHLLGVGGALRLIDLAASNPNAKAAEVFGSAAQANRSIFYDQTGAARSVAQVRHVITARFDVARASKNLPSTAQAASAPPATSTAMATATPPATAVAAPDTAGITDAFASAIPKPAAGDNQIFHGLFADARTAPLAPMVGVLWGAPASVAPSGGSVPQKSTANSMHDLFKDPDPVKGT
jgi:Transglycosylase SLT domain